MGVPEGWTSSLLDDAAHRRSGHTPNKKIPEYWNGGIKWVSLADSSKLDDRYISITDKEISQAGLENSSAVLLPKGTVVLSRDAGVGKSAILGDEMAVSQHFIAWTCDRTSKLDNWFLYFWMQMKKPLFERMAVGSTIKTIGLPFFKKLRIDHPPLPEQRKIAEILSVWDRAIEVSEALLATATAQKRSLMQSLLTGHRRFPEFKGQPWKEVRLGELGSFKKGKGLPKTKVGLTGKYPCVLYGELYTKYGEVIREPQSYTDLDDGVVSKSGDVLIPASTTTTGIDLAIASCVLDDDVRLGGDINIFRAFSGNIDGVYLAYFLTHIRRHEMARFAQGVTIIHLKGSDLLGISIKVPPIAEQEKIAAAINVVEAEIDAHRTDIHHLRTEKKALMQQLLTGKRRVVV